MALAATEVQASTDTPNQNELMMKKLPRHLIFTAGALKVSAIIGQGMCSIPMRLYMSACCMQVNLVLYTRGTCKQMWWQ